MDKTSPSFRAFILGERRSGSNFLRTTLNACSQIAAPHPPHIIHTFHDLAGHYGDPHKNANWQRLVEDVVHCVNLSPVRLLASEQPLSVQAVARQSVERSLAGLQDAIYREAMNEEGKSGWICKSNDNIHYLEDIERAYGTTAKYLFLIRDGRDVAMSFRKAPIGPKHPYVAGTQWARIQQSLLAWEARVGERSLRIRYEDLLQNQAAEVRRICDFLGVAFEDRMLSPEKTSEAQRTAHQSVLWRNIDKPLMVGNFNKFREDEPENVRLFECAAGETLQRLGYELMHEPGAECSSAEVSRFMQEDVRLRKEAQTTFPRDHGQREAQSRFLKTLREQFGVHTARASTIAGL